MIHIQLGRRIIHKQHRQLRAPVCVALELRQEQAAASSFCCPRETRPRAPGAVQPNHQIRAMRPDGRRAAVRRRATRSRPAPPRESGLRSSPRVARARSRRRAGALRRARRSRQSDVDILRSLSRRPASPASTSSGSQALHLSRLTAASSAAFRCLSARWYRRQLPTNHGFTWNTPQSMKRRRSSGPPSIRRWTPGSIDLDGQDLGDLRDAGDCTAIQPRSQCLARWPRHPATSVRVTANGACRRRAGLGALRPNQ